MVKQASCSLSLFPQKVDKGDKKRLGVGGTYETEFTVGLIPRAATRESRRRQTESGADSRNFDPRHNPDSSQSSLFFSNCALHPISLCVHLKSRGGHFHTQRSVDKDKTERGKDTDFFFFF